MGLKEDIADVEQTLRNYWNCQGKSRFEYAAWKRIRAKLAERRKTVRRKRAVQQRKEVIVRCAYIKYCVSKRGGNCKWNGNCCWQRPTPSIA